MLVRTGRDVRGKTALVVWALGLSAAYFAITYAAISLSSHSFGVAAIWPANALVVAFMLLSHQRSWTILLLITFVTNIAVNAATTGTVLGPVVCGLANCLEITVAACGLRALPRSRIALFDNPSTAIRFGLVAGLIAPLAGSVPGPLAVHTLFGRGFLEAAAIWFGSHALGLILFTPFFHAVLTNALWRCFWSRNWWQRAEAFGLHVAVVASCWVFVQDRYPLLFLPFLPLALVTFRLGWLGTCTGLVVIAIGVTMATDLGMGPANLIEGSILWREVFVEFYLICLLLMNIPVAMALAARRELTDRLELANARLAEANLGLERFASIASHDLRAPVRHVSLFADAIRKELGGQQPLSQHADNIIRAAGDMNRIIKALLTFSKSGFREPACSWFRIDSLVSQLRQSFVEIDAADRALIEFHVSAVLIFADRQLVLQALRNVIGNSVKYVADGTVPEIRVSIDQPDPYHVIFEVQDNGIGIAPRFAEEVFLPLRRLYGADSAYEGVGLGLSLVKTIARAHGGDAWIDAGNTVGTRVFISFANQAAEVSSRPAGDYPLP